MNPGTHSRVKIVLAGRFAVQLLTLTGRSATHIATHSNNLAYDVLPKTYRGVRAFYVIENTCFPLAGTPARIDLGCCTNHQEAKQQD
jgi:hypothetical protein